MTDDFDWGATNEDVILPEQRTTAVYVNTWGQAVIRQERAWCDDEDTWVVIDHAHIPAVIKALRDIADRPVCRDDRPNEPEQRSAPASTKGEVVVLNEHIAEKARGEHSRATE